MDVEIMQAEAAINDFINTFISLANDDHAKLDREEVEIFEKLLYVAKTVHLAQLMIKKTIGEDVFNNLKDGGDES